jgi:hypothetical protein
MNKKAQTPGTGQSDFMSPMLFQYVVALCCARRNPDAVDITVGDYVTDATTGAQRDVDVTVTLLEADGSRRAFRGYEVKREGSPLDVTEVEQLCMKFMDMPDVTHRAIVSASGYTANAKKKAKAHGVELFERKEWTRPVSELIPELDRMGPPAEAFQVRTMGLIWSECSYYLIAPEGPGAFQWTAAQALFSQSGASHSVYTSVGSYFEALRLRSQGALWAIDPIQKHVTPAVVEQAERQGTADTPPWEHTHTLDVERDGVYLRFEQEGLVQITAVHIYGHLQWQVRKRVPQFFVLENVDTREVFAGTAIAEGTAENAFMGLVFAPGSRDISVHPRIELSERQRSVIRQLKLLSETPATEERD